MVVTAPALPPRGSPRTGSSTHTLVILFYIFLAVALTWPMVAQLTTHVPAGDDDLWQNYWNFWWWKSALVEQGQSPYKTDLLFHPNGAALGLHTHSEANQLMLLPVNVALGVPAALNLSFFLGFVLAAFGAWLLAREYTQRPEAAFIAGLIFGFFPHHIERSLEHLNLASIQGIPLCLWALVRTVRLGGRNWILLALLFSYNCLLGWHNAMMTVPFAAALLFHEMRRTSRKNRELWIDLLKAAALAGLIMLPFMWPMVRDALERVGRFRKGVASRSIDPLFLLVPHPGHPLWGPMVQGLYEKMRTYSSVGFVAYAGFTPLLLAGAALAGSWRRLKDSGSQRSNIFFWSGTGIFFLLLSLGKTLTFAGTRYESIPLPFALFSYVPFFSRVRVPHRFLVPAMLCLAILAALGAQALMQRWSSRTRLITTVVAMLIILEFAWIPYPMQKVPEFSWVEELRKFPPELAVMDIPGGHRARGADDMLLQTFHGRPITSGYVSIPMRNASRTIKHFPIMRRIFQSRSTDTGYEGPDLAATVRALDAGIVVVHLNRTAERIAAARAETARDYPGDHYKLLAHEPEEGMPKALLDRLRAELKEAFGPPVFSDGEDVEIYRVTTVDDGS
jgi:hypothetical protein